MLDMRIRQARERLGWSQEDLARRMSVTQPSISSWESGMKAPRTRIMGRLAVTLGVSFEWLSTGRGEITPATPVTMLTAGESKASPYLPEREEDESRLLVCYARLKPQQRVALLGFLESLRG
jgi:HTH-type transcriptional regulator, cell division transcriptional repressor